MYNGIGLQTARGSGTNGYVQRNLSSIKPKQFHRNPNYDRPPTKREPDPEIIEHEKKRRVEIQVLELQDQLEEEGLSENEIIEKTDALRQQLLKDLHKIVIRNEHQSLLDKQKMDSKLQRAFGIEDDYVEGSAFDENFQEQKRLRKQQEWEERQRKRELQSQRQDRRSPAPQRRSRSPPVRRPRDSPARRDSRSPVRRPSPPRSDSRSPPARRVSRSPGRSDSESPARKRREVSESPARQSRKRRDSSESPERSDRFKRPLRRYSSSPPHHGFQSK